MKALYLSGGGARAAYQVGVLKGIQEVMSFKGRLPFDLISCVSAGAINATALAQHADDFTKGVEVLETFWRKLKCSDVFVDSNWAIFKSLLRHIWEFTFSNLKSGYLLDTTPLEKLIETNVDFERINALVASGVLKAFDVATNCYELSETVSFFNSTNPFVMWRRIRHISYRTEIKCEHIIASSAIPLFFPAKKIDALHYGDGTMRLSAPLRGAIQLGANDILIISTRARGNPHELRDRGHRHISFGKLLGSMMNALFLDNLDRDLEMLNRINGMLAKMDEQKTHWRQVDTTHFSPTDDLATFVGDADKNVPRLLRFLLRSLGSKEQSSDFLSFLLFDGQYAGKLIDLGYKNALNGAERIQTFFAK